MNLSNETKEEIYKCSKCGLCHSVCPIFLATKNELYSPRGRFIVLNEHINYGYKLTKEFKKNLDFCLHCNLCKDFCPSVIDSTSIFIQLKDLFNYKYSFYPFYFKYFLLLFFQSFIPQKVLVKRIKNTNKFKDKKAKVFYFQGCINKYINPSDKNATLNLLEYLNYDVVKISNICCGLPYINDTLNTKFEKNAKKIVNSIPTDVEYIVCSCDSCAQTLKKIDVIKQKVITIDELLKINKYSLDFDDTVNYFKPLIRKSDCYLPTNVPSINKKGLFSLMENFLLIKYPKFAISIAEHSLFGVEKIENKAIILSSMLDYYAHFIYFKKHKKIKNVYTYSEYINLLTINK